MWWKVLGVAVVVLVGGVAVGYAVGQDRADQPVAIRSVRPVAAVSPAYPLLPSVTALPDPTQAPLPVDLPAMVQHLSTGKHGSQLTVAIPDGWVVNRQSQTRWTWTAPGNPFDTYGLRIDIVAGSLQSVQNYKDSRILALRETQHNGHLSHFTITGDSADTFEATYVQNGYLRLTMERVLSLGQGSAYADVAVTGRLSDKDGLTDLLARTSASMVAA